jgi:hypothetical protein
MWTMIASLEVIVDDLRPAFTTPAFVASCDLLLGWVMCLGRHRLWRVAANAHPHEPADHSRRHGFDTYYNFFERSAWTPTALAYRVAVLILTRLPFSGPITLLVDDTLAHKRGRSVWGLGWFRDAVASTQKRVATASGHNWVVVAVAVCLPGSGIPVLALPLLARLHLPGKAQRSCPELARLLLAEVLAWFPDRDFILVGDGAYASKRLLGALDRRVAFVGRLRGDAAVYDPTVPPAPAGRRGRKAQKGPRLPAPKAAAAKADRARSARALGLAGSDRHAVRPDAGPAGAGLRRGVADGLGAAAGARGRGPRPRGPDAGRLLVHDGPAREPGVGHHAIRLAVGD